MTFSILQAVYKNASPIFLNECLSSIKDSTIQPAKIILVKDGTIPAELESVISEWQNNLPLQVVGYEQNQGLAHALNFGLQFVDTDLVARMDSDDYCFPERFEKQLAYFRSYPEVEILGTGISEFYLNEDGNVFRKNRFYPQYSNNSSKKLFKGTPLGHPTVMMKSELLKNFRYSENTNMNEDIDLWFRLIRGGHTLYNLEESLLNFRITDGTFKRRSIKKAFSEFKIYWKNLYALFGFSPLLVYPIARLCIRFLPYGINKKLYFSNMRKKFFKQDVNTTCGVGEESILLP